MTYCINSHHTKLANQGTQEVQVSFADGHTISTYHVLNPKTCKISPTKGMTFLGRSYGE